MKRIFSIIYLTYFLSTFEITSVFAQSITIGTTTTTSSYFYGPYYRSSASSVFNYSRYCYLYLSSELGIPSGATITKIEWQKASGTISTPNTFQILLKNSTSTSLTTGSSWSSLSSGATSVYNSTNQSFLLTSGWEAFNFTTGFNYTGGSLMILTDHIKSGTASAANNYYYTSAIGKSLGFASNAAPTATTTLSSATYGDNRPNIRITYVFNNTTSCGLSISGSCANPSSIQIGTGTLVNSSTTYPAIYGNYYRNTRHQILYKASELIAAGVQAGKISSIAFNVTAINGITVYPDFTIKMKCTTAADLTSTAFDNTGLNQVYYTPTANITTGWNTYNFSNAYEWDGVSNLLVDICSSITPTTTLYPNGWSNNSSSPYTATSFYSVRSFVSDAVVACMTTNTANVSFNRPNSKFGNCPTCAGVSPPPAVSGYTICQAGTTLISATPTSGANTIRWYNVSSAGTVLFTGINYQPSVSSTTTYYAASYNSTSGCESSSRTPVTVNLSTPLAPTSVSGSTICQAGTAAISATPTSGANTIRWYTASTGGTLLFTGTNYTANYTSTTVSYAASYNSTTGCESSIRTAVTVTLNSTSAPLSVSGATLCQSGSATISATSSSGANTINWYTASIGGTLLFTGISYQPIVSSTTTFYAAGYNPTTGCESSSRVAVTIYVNSLLAPISVDGDTICELETASVSAVPSAGGNTINWYSNSSGGTILSTGLNYNNFFTNNTTLYAASYNSSSGCESLTRFPVNIVVHPNPTISYSATNSNYGGNVAIDVIITQGVAPYLFDWNFDGEGDFDDLQNQISIAPGNYTLVVKDNNGCKATAFILIESDYNLSFATGISPNNDGKNDTWIILGTQQFDDLEINIYDVFGQCINRQEKNYIPWDGFYNGKLVPEGEYYFIITSVKKKKKITGTVLVKY